MCRGEYEERGNGNGDGWSWNVYEDVVWWFYSFEREFNELDEYWIEWIIGLICCVLIIFEEESGCCGISEEEENEDKRIRGGEWKIEEIGGDLLKDE